jgi:hypothetical protein
VHSILDSQLVALRKQQYELRELHQGSLDAILLGQSQAGDAWKAFAQTWDKTFSFHSTHVREMISSQLGFFYHGTSAEHAMWIAHQQKFNPCYSKMAVHGKGCYVSRDPCLASSYAMDPYRNSSRGGGALVVCIGFMGRHHRQEPYKSDEITYDEDDTTVGLVSGYPEITSKPKEPKDAKKTALEEPETEDEVLSSQEIRLRKQWVRVSRHQQQQYLEQTCDCILPTDKETDMVCVRNPAIMFPVCVVLLKSK